MLLEIQTSPRDVGVHLDEHITQVRLPSEVPYCQVTLGRNTTGSSSYVGFRFHVISVDTVMWQSDYAKSLQSAWHGPHDRRISQGYDAVNSWLGAVSTSVSTTAFVCGPEKT